MWQTFIYGSDMVVTILYQPVGPRRVWQILIGICTSKISLGPELYKLLLFFHSIGGTNITCFFLCDWQRGMGKLWPKLERTIVIKR